MYYYIASKKNEVDLAGVAQWIERWPENLQVTVPSLARAQAWVVGQVPSWGHVGGS